MVYVVAKKNSVVIAKEVYVADIKEVQNEIKKRSEADNTLTFDFYDDSQIDLFNAVQIVVKDKVDWTTAKSSGTVAVIQFIGRKLGLE